MGIPGSPPARGYLEVVSMSKEDLIAALRAIKAKQDLKGGYIEQNHLDADSLLLAYINDPEVAEIFTDLERWYA